MPFRLVITLQMMFMLVLGTLVIRQQAEVWRGAHEVARLQSQRSWMTEKCRLLDVMLTGPRTAQRLTERAATMAIALTEPPLEQAKEALARLRNRDSSRGVEVASASTSRRADRSKADRPGRHTRRKVAAR